MKKKSPIKDIIQSTAIGLFSIGIIALFSAIGQCSIEKHNKAIQSTSDNIELNEVEQYHLSEGRHVKFIEDILP